MQANVGTMDRVLRVVLGVVLIALAILNYIGPWGYIGLMPLVTGLFRFCPAYALFGFDTCPMKKGQAGSS